jgi:hypothetical protein
MRLFLSYSKISRLYLIFNRNKFLEILSFLEWHLLSYNSTSVISVTDVGADYSELRYVLILARKPLYYVITVNNREIILFGQKIMFKSSWKCFQIKIHK